MAILDEAHQINADLKPNTLNLPHDEWRPHQLETINWALARDGYLILSAPTGSGKTSVAAAIATKTTVTALTRTKSLQAENYGSTYGFSVLFGKGSYKCSHIERPGTYADTCPFAEGGMSKCEYAKQCEYLIRKKEAITAADRSLNYAYYLGARWPRANGVKSETLILDEAHELPDIVLEWAGLSISNKTRYDWGLPYIPKASSTERTQLYGEKTAIEKLLDWMTESLFTLAARLSELAPDVTTPADSDEMKKYRQCENLIRKIEATKFALEQNSQDWYIRSGLQDDNTIAIVCKPLTARYHFTNLFNAERVLIMSATIGDPATFAAELGIEEYEYKSVPNQFAPHIRPVLDLKAPSMGKKATDADFEKQADIIAQAILDCPHDWSGVIHVTRKSESNLLAQRLAKRGLGGRVWTPNFNDGTNLQMRKWKQDSSRRPGLIAVAWTWWAGVDLTQERICIVAKTPFPTLGDSFERARMSYNGKTYLWRTAVLMEQGLGRTRRGDPSDYDLNGNREQLVAIADGSWRRVKSYLSPDLFEAIQA